MRDPTHTMLVALLVLAAVAIGGCSVGEGPTDPEGTFDTSLFVSDDDRCKGNVKLYNVKLHSEQELPSLATSGKGKFKFKLNDAGTLNYTLSAKGLDSEVTQAHIHMMSCETDGPIVAFLFEFVPGGVMVGREVASGTLTDADLIGPLAGHTIADLCAVIDAGAYVDVHTVSNPAGEIRGQLGDRIPSGIIRVPEDLPTIRTAIIASCPGDVIEVACGTYYESDIIISTPDLTVRGEAEGCVVIDAGEKGRHFETKSSSLALEGLTFINGRIVGPWGATGGSILLGGNVSISDCTFEKNYASWRGGAIFVRNNASLVVTDTRIRDNKIGFNDLNGPHAAGIWSSGRLEATRCEFVANIAGPGFYNNSSGAAAVVSHSGSGIFSDCLFKDNVVSESPFTLGAVFVTGGSAAFEGCTFVNNAGPTGAAVSLNVVTSARFDSCVFVGNSSTNHGSAVYARICNPVFENCTMIASSGGQSATYFEGCSVTMKNVLISGSINASAVSGTFSSFDISCSNLFGNENGDWVGVVSHLQYINRNLSSDPLYCNPAAGDYTIDFYSPCSPFFSLGCGLIGALPIGCNLP